MPLGRLKQVAGAVGRFFGPVPGAVRDHLNVREIARIAATALVSGWSASMAAAALAASVGTVFTGPEAAAGAATLALVIEVCRRLGHGTPLDTTPAPPPTVPDPP